MPRPRAVPEDHRRGAGCAATPRERADREHARAVVPRGDARQRSATTRMASATTIRCGAIRTMRRARAGAASSRCRVFCSRPAGSSPAMSAGCPGVHAMWAGADWTWHLPVRRNDAITHRGVAEGTDRASDAVRRPLDPAGLSRGFLQPARRAWWPPPTAGASAPIATRRASRAASTREVKATAAAALLGRRSWPHLPALRRRGGARRHSAILGATLRVGDRLPTMVEGADDGDRLHRLRAGLGRALHPREQARMEADPCASRPRHHQPLRHPRLSRARALGAGVRPHGRRARRLRLRPGALLVADASSHQLDGRRRDSCGAQAARSAGTIRKATRCSSKAPLCAASSRTAAT